MPFFFRTAAMKSCILFASVLIITGFFILIRRYCLDTKQVNKKKCEVVNIGC